MLRKDPRAELALQRVVQWASDSPSSALHHPLMLARLFPRRRAQSWGQPEMAQAAAGSGATSATLNEGKL
jgi:hypothetical protein